MAKILQTLLEARFGNRLSIDTPGDLHPVHEQMLSHRSHRRYKPDPISKETVDLLLACALSAPAKSDLQQVSIINFDDPVLREKVTDLVPSMPWIKQAPVFLLFCGDGRRIKRICEMRGTEFRHDPIDAFMNAAADAAIAMQNFVIAAQAAGLGCCPISGVRDATEELVKLAKLPEDVFPFVGMTLGVPDDDPKITMRLGPPVAVHSNAYQDDGLEEALAAYDAQRRDAMPYRRQRDIDTYGEKLDYGWSDDKARQTSHLDRLSFIDYIQKHVLRTF